MSSKLIRWSGLAGMLGGVLFVAAIILIPRPPAPPPWWATHAVVHLLLAVPALCCALGVYGLYRRLAPSVGRWRKAAVLVFLIGWVGLAIGTSGETVAAQFGGPDGEGLIHELSFLTTIVSFPIMAIGSVLFAIAVVPSKLLPRWGTLLLIAGPLSILSLNDRRDIAVVFAVLFAAGWIWLGYILWSGREEAKGHSQPVAQSGKEV